MGACYMLVIVCLVGTVTGCGARQERKNLHLSTALGKVDYPSGARIHTMPVRAGMRFAPREGMGKASEMVFAADGWLVFIDETPDADWAHQFKLLFVRQADGATSTLFNGKAMPDFQLFAGENIVAKRWEKY